MARNRPRMKPRIHEWLASYSFIREKFVDGLWVQLASLRELQSPALRSGDGSQSASREELRPLFGRTLMPSILDKAFKGQL